MTKSDDTELKKHALTQFDKLVQQGEIIWQDTKPRYISATPFDVTIQTSR
jgi:hypothetical protein